MNISRYKAAPLDCTIATHLDVVVKAFNTMSQWSVSVGQWRENGGVKWQDVDRRWQMPIPCRDLETLILWGNYLKHVKLETLRGWRRWLHRRRSMLETLPDASPPPCILQLVRIIFASAFFFLLHFLILLLFVYFAIVPYSLSHFFHTACSRFSLAIVHSIPENNLLVTPP